MLVGPKPRTRHTTSRDGIALYALHLHARFISSSEHLVVSSTSLLFVTMMHPYLTSNRLDLALRLSYLQITLVTCRVGTACNLIVVIYAPDNNTYLERHPSSYEAAESFRYVSPTLSSINAVDQSSPMTSQGPEPREAHASKSANGILWRSYGRYPPFVPCFSKKTSAHRPNVTRVYTGFTQARVLRTLCLVYDYSLAVFLSHYPNGNMKHGNAKLRIIDLLSS